MVKIAKEDKPRNINKEPIKNKSSSKSSSSSSVSSLSQEPSQDNKLEVLEVNKEQFTNLHQSTRETIIAVLIADNQSIGEDNEPSYLKYLRTCINRLNTYNPSHVKYVNYKELSEKLKEKNHNKTKDKKKKSTVKK